MSNIKNILRKIYEAVIKPSLSSKLLNILKEILLNPDKKIYLKHLKNKVKKDFFKVQRVLDNYDFLSKKGDKTKYYEVIDYTGLLKEIHELDELIANREHRQNQVVLTIYSIMITGMLTAGLVLASLMQVKEAGIQTAIQNQNLYLETNADLSIHKFDFHWGNATIDNVIAEFCLLNAGTVSSGQITITLTSAGTPPYILPEKLYLEEIPSKSYSCFNQTLQIAANESISGMNVSITCMNCMREILRAYIFP